MKQKRLWEAAIIDGVRAALPTRHREGAVIYIVEFKGVLPPADGVKRLLPNDTGTAPVRFVATVRGHLYGAAAGDAGREATVEVVRVDRAAVKELRDVLYDTIRNFDSFAATVGGPKNRTSEGA